MVIVALAVIDAAVAVIIAIASHGWQSQAMAGPLPSLFLVFHHDSECGEGWGEGGARGGSWRPPLPPLTVDAVIVVVVVLTITWLRGGGRGGCTRGILAAPPPPPRSRCRHRRRRSCSLLERRLAIAVIVIIATVTFYESVHQCELHSRVNCYERCNPRGVPCLGQQV